MGRGPSTASALHRAGFAHVIGYFGPVGDMLCTRAEVAFYQSLARRSALLRRAGLVVIGAAVAKVFLIDISGLEGLTRVFSLMVLGLSLAGLAWLNRWAQDRTLPK